MSVAEPNQDASWRRARRRAAPGDAPKPHRWTRAEYQRLGQIGFFTAEDRVELIEGEIIDMAPIGSDHDGNNRFLTMFLAPKLDGRAIVSVQGVLGIGDDSEPEPDVVVLKPRDDYYKRSHAEPSDALLVIEVASSSRSFDLGRKAEMYAKGGVCEYWVVDMPQQQVVRHLGPKSSGEWETIESIGGSGELAPRAFPDLKVPLSPLFTK